MDPDFKIVSCYNCKNELGLFCAIRNQDMLQMKCPWCKKTVEICGWDLIVKEMEVTAKEPEGF